MKHLTYAILFSILTLFGVTTSCPQAAVTDKITVPLSDPSQPAMLKVNIMNGSITVKGYSGKDVLVEARSPDNIEEDEGDRVDDEKLAKRRGMRRITNTGSGLSVEEDHNEVSVGAGWRNMGNTLALTIQVPVNSSMKLSTLNGGDITVTGVNGDLELSNMNGGITLTDISGSVVADALNRDIRVVFNGVDPKKSMSFSSMNGDIDVTLPSTVKATLRLKNDMGEIYSDFDMKIDNATSRVENNARGKMEPFRVPDNKRGRVGPFKVTLEKLMTGKINGGGAEITFKNFNGDIYIRKGK